MPVLKHLLKAVKAPPPAEGRVRYTSKAQVREAAKRVFSRYRETMRRLAE